ncbi:putative fluoride ion transporter CrcB [Amorphoplanes digitatis]|nr:putative fluoride ion transporter CrcB [Actinoplanes digitatis]
MDPDVDLSTPAGRAELGPHALPVLAAISAGGVLGALARWGIGAAWPHDPRAFAWSTWTINLTGCLLIGVLMVFVTRVWPRRRLIRPFWGVGVLGGYTTFSGASVDALRAAPGTGLIYVAATLVGALLAVWAGTAAGEAMVRR